MSLTRDDVKTKVVQPAVETIGNFSGDIDTIQFSALGANAAYQPTFLTAVKSNLNGLTVTDEQGNTYPQYMYDVVLNDSIFASWTTVGDCTDYVAANYGTGPR